MERNNKWREFIDKYTKIGGFLTTLVTKKPQVSDFTSVNTRFRSINDQNGNFCTLKSPKR